MAEAPDKVERRILEQGTVGEHLASVSRNLLPQPIQEDANVQWVLSYKGSDPQYEAGSDPTQIAYHAAGRMVSSLLQERLPFYTAALFHIGRQWKISESLGKEALRLQDEKNLLASEQNVIVFAEKAGRDLDPSLIRENVIAISNAAADQHGRSLEQAHGWWTIWTEEVTDLREAVLAFREQAPRPAKDDENQQQLRWLSTFSSFLFVQQRPSRTRYALRDGGVTFRDDVDPWPMTTATVTALLPLIFSFAASVSGFHSRWAEEFRYFVREMPIEQAIREGEERLRALYGNHNPFDEFAVGKAAANGLNSIDKHTRRQRHPEIAGPSMMERGMVDASIGQRLVDEMISNLPKHDPGQRPVHTIGVGVDGYFTASDVAHKYCIAEHFSGQRICAKVRFSNASGGPEQHDGWTDVRGMATRFLLPSGAATDLIATTLREFFARNVEDFLEFTKSDKHTAYQRESPWRKILDMLQLKVPRRDPYKDEKANASAGILSYANRHRFAQLAVFEFKMIGAPVSYARVAYHAIHTFIVEGEGGVRRPVRFSWQPVAGVRNTNPDAPPDDNYLRQELDARLQRWPARFVLMMTIGEAGDAIDDPTRPWPARRVRIVMGTLTLTGVPEDQSAAGERISFNPWRLVPGIEPSGDPILHARRDAYEVSRKMRGGTACPFSNWSCADGE